MALAWGVGIALGFLGWGIFLLRCLRLTYLPLTVAGPLGVCVFVAFGGFLNLGRLIITPVLCVLIATGVTFFLHHVLTEPQVRLSLGSLAASCRKRPAYAGIGLVLFGVIGLLAFTSSQRRLFSPDDTGFYLVYPEKVLLTGTLPLDPFNGSRTMSSLGANYFLQALMLPVSGIRSLAFPDIGIGYMFLAGIAYFLARASRLSRRHGLLLAVIAVSLPFLSANLQMCVLPASLLLTGAALVLALEGPSLAILLGLIAGTVSTLKGTYPPGAVLLVALYYLADVKGRWQRRLSHLCLAGLSALALTGPWMFDEQRKTGTYFYPLFGTGNVHGDYIKPSFRYIAEATLPLALPLIILALTIFVCAGRLRNLSRVGVCALALTVSAACSVLIVGYATRGESVGRYNFPYIDAASIVVVAWVWSEKARAMIRNDWFRYAAPLVACWVLFLQTYYGLYNPIGDYRRNFAEIRLLFFPDDNRFPNLARLDDGSLARDRAEALRYQDVVPPGATLLSIVAEPFALDYKRNKIYIGDGTGFPPMAPGIPGEDQQTLLECLRGNKIPFLAFTYGPDPQMTLRTMLASTPGRRVRVYTQNLGAAKTMVALDKLSHVVRVVFDDGHTRVLDLRP